MSISSVANSSILAALQSLTTNSSSAQSSASTSNASTSSASSGSGSSSAYTLSLGQQQASSELLSYSQLGKLINNAEQNFTTIVNSGTQAAITDGNGTTMTKQYSVDVQQLASAQSVATGAAAADGLATGTLTIQAGAFDAASNSFTAQGSAATVAITDGSLTGIAQAINAAGTGVTAAVVQSDGQSTLQLTGPSGAANAFTISGIDGLDYDPTDPAASSLTASSAAADAEFTVDGGSQQTSASNSNAAIGMGVVANFTATGTMTVSAPLNVGTIALNAQSLAGTFNDMLDGLSQIGDTTSKNLTKTLEAVVGESFGGKSLSDIGITQASDGTLSVNATTLQAAFTADPTGTSKVLDQAAAAIKDALAGTAGGGDQVKSQMQALVTSLMQTPSLIDYLNSASSSSGGTNSLFGGSSSTSASSSSASSSSDISQLLASLTATST